MHKLLKNFEIKKRGTSYLSIFYHRKSDFFFYRKYNLTIYS
ncbi:hypothetical protein LEP1GSC029_5030, partial [Leptospira interrogans str. 2002000626]